MIHKRKAPHIEYILASDDFICPNIRKSIYRNYLRYCKEEVPVYVDGGIRKKARLALERMLELSY